MKLPWLAISLGAVCLASSALAEDFSVGGFALSETVSETGVGGGESWNDEGKHRVWHVTLANEGSVLRYGVSMEGGNLGEPPTEAHHMSIYATYEHQGFLIDFEGASDSKEDTNSRDFLDSCAREVTLLGGATKSV
ncbi:MAG TPA: hypothetical protein VMT54_08575, partial [Candidatus Cybelea sp.]|nr:hypothetical protein [Candidatus Cybelea sp.]